MKKGVVYHILFLAIPTAAANHPLQSISLKAHNDILHRPTPPISAIKSSLERSFAYLYSTVPVLVSTTTARKRKRFRGPCQSNTPLAVYNLVDPLESIIIGRCLDISISRLHQLIFDTRASSLTQHNLT
jgi:hypothetical protein